MVDAYVVVYANRLIPGGARGDRYGRKGLFLVGVALFGIGSLALVDIGRGTGFVACGLVTRAGAEPGIDSSPESLAGARHNLDGLGHHQR